MFALCTERGRLEISARGEIVRLCHGETEYLETTAAAPLASVWYAEAASMWQATAWQELAPDNPTVSEIPGGVCVAADTFGGKAVRVRIEITADRREFRFRVTVRNDDAGVVAAVAAPRIEGFRDRGGDTLYVPNVSGRRAAQPFHGGRHYGRCPKSRLMAADASLRLAGGNLRDRTHSTNLLAVGINRLEV